MERNFLKLRPYKTILSLKFNMRNYNIKTDSMNKSDFEKFTTLLSNPEFLY